MNFRGFIFLIFLGICILFVVQNLQPISLVFFGGNPITLPLSIWILLFTGAGFISSLIIQTLNKVTSSTAISDNVPQPQQPPYYYPPSPPSSPTTPTKTRNLEERPSFENYAPEKIHSPSEYSNLDTVKNLGSDRELESNERDWSEPMETKAHKQEIMATNQEDTNVEVEQNPQTKSRSASLYSYQPRERTQIRAQLKPTSKPKPKSKSQDEVYEANYRVITPPYRDNDRPMDEDEEWDF